MKATGRITFLSMTLIVLLAACQQQPKPFLHNMPAGGQVPWLSEQFDDAEGKFTFAIVTDLNGGERPGVFDVAVEQLNLLRPELIVTVGDLLDGETEDLDSLKMEFDRFDQRAGKAKAPLFHVGGNHDLTNPVMRSIWKDRYGAHYYHFVYKNVLFLVLDTEDYTDARREEIHQARNAAIKMMDGPTPEKASEMEYFKMPERVTGQVGKEQSAYFEDIIGKYPKVSWTVLFMHKPVWKTEGEGSLEGIEKALQGRPYTVFNGHFHSYSHAVKNDRDYMILGTTGGSQNAKDPNAFDHVTLVTMSADGPSIANLRLDGILNKYGKLPLNGNSLCFQASHCNPPK